MSSKLTEYSTACDSGLITIVPGSGPTINEGCIAAVTRLCKNRQDGIGGVPTNILSDYTSNCPQLKFFMENVLVPETFGTVAEYLNQTYMDPLKLDWCAQPYNYNNSECLCLSVFQRNLQFNNQCRLNITSCSGFPADPSECYGRFFSKQNDGSSYDGQSFTPDKQFINISFDRCQPYYCWTDICWDPDVYKTYGAFRSQTVGCGNVCITVKGENTLTINDISNAGFNNIRPATTTMPICNRNSDAINLFYLPQIYRAPVNLFTIIPVNVGNQSNGINAYMQLVSSESNNPYGFWLNPPLNSQGLIEVPGNAQITLNFTVDTQMLNSVYSLKTPVPNPSRGNVPEVVVCDDSDASANSCGNLTPNQYILSPSYKYSYVQTQIDPATGDPYQITTFITLYANMIVLPQDLTPTVPSTKTVANEDPSWARYLIVVCVLIFILAYIAKTLANTYAVRLYPLLKQASLSPPPL